MSWSPRGGSSPRQRVFVFVRARRARCSQESSYDYTHVTTAVPPQFFPRTVAMPCIPGSTKKSQQAYIVREREDVRTSWTIILIQPSAPPPIPPPPYMNGFQNCARGCVARLLVDNLPGPTCTFLFVVAIVHTCDIYSSGASCTVPGEVCDEYTPEYIPVSGLPPRVPWSQVLYFLSGLTCTDENFMGKAGAQRTAAQRGVALVAPDTSPRGAGVAGEVRRHTIVQYDPGFSFGTLARNHRDWCRLVSRSAGGDYVLREIGAWRVGVTALRFDLMGDGRDG